MAAISWIRIVNGAAIVLVPSRSNLMSSTDSTCPLSLIRPSMPFSSIALAIASFTPSNSSPSSSSVSERSKDGVPDMSRTMVFADPCDKPVSLSIPELER